MRIVSQQTILMNYHTLFLSKTRKDVAKFVVCCSHDWCIFPQKMKKMSHNLLSATVQLTSNTLTRSLSEEMMDLYFFIIDFPLSEGVISWKGFSAAPAAFVSSWHEINELPNKTEKCIVSLTLLYLGTLSIISSVYVYAIPSTKSLASLVLYRKSVHIDFFSESKKIWPIYIPATKVYVTVPCFNS